MTELLPCPFCGGEDLEIDHAQTYDVYHPDVYEVHCVECGGRGGEGWTEAESIEAWNTRAERTCHDETKSRDFFTCSNCHEPIGKWAPNYCPYCGAKVVDE